MTCLARAAEENGHVFQMGLAKQTNISYLTVIGTETHGQQHVMVTIPTMWVSFVKVRVQT